MCIFKLTWQDKQTKFIFIQMFCSTTWCKALQRFTNGIHQIFPDQDKNIISLDNQNRKFKNQMTIYYDIMT